CTTGEGSCRGWLPPCRRSPRCHWRPTRGSGDLQAAPASDQRVHVADGGNRQSAAGSGVQGLQCAHLDGRRHNLLGGVGSQRGRIDRVAKIAPLATPPILAKPWSCVGVAALDAKHPCRGPVAQFRFGVWPTKDGTDRAICHGLMTKRRWNKSAIKRVLTLHKRGC